MVQRYEQMRRLQWYKRGAAYVIPHDFLTTLYQILHIIVEKLAMDSIRERLRFHEGVSLFIGLRGIN